MYFSPKEELTIEVKGNNTKEAMEYRTTIAFFKNGERISTLHDEKQPTLLPTGAFTSEFKIPAYFFRPGEYMIAIGGHNGMPNANGNEWIWGTDIVYFNILEEWSENNDMHNIGIVNMPYKAQRFLS